MSSILLQYITVYISSDRIFLVSFIPAERAYFEYFYIFDMDWLLGRKSSNSPSSSPASAPPRQPEPAPSIFQQQDYQAPSIDSLLKPHDPAALHPLANLDKETLDYIILEDEQIKSAGALPSRGWTDDLCYGTGTTYLTGIFNSACNKILTLVSSRSRRNMGILRSHLKVKGSSSSCNSEPFFSFGQPIKRRCSSRSKCSFISYCKFSDNSTKRQINFE